jgi:hypothetical protein
MTFKKIALAMSIILTCAAPALSQGRKPLPQGERDMYLVSAQAGVVNAVEGEAIYRRDGGSWDALTAREELQAYDRIRTGAGARVEILLNPGAYLRLSENAELVITETEAKRVQVFISKGSAIVEASVVDGYIGVATPRAELAIVRGGLYRFNVSEDGRSEILARKGMLVVAGSKMNVGGGDYVFGGTKVKEGKQIIAGDSGPYISPMADKKAQDEFDLWSKQRARTIIAANKRLPIKDMLRSIPLGMMSNVWVYDRFSGCYTFLPGFYNLYSPYGYRYERGTFWPGQCCNNGHGYGSGGGGYWGGSGGSNSGGGSMPGSGGSGGGHPAPGPVVPNAGGSGRSGMSERPSDGRAPARKP